MIVLPLYFIIDQFTLILKITGKWITVDEKFAILYVQIDEYNKYGCNVYSHKYVQMRSDFSFTMSTSSTSVDIYYIVAIMNN